MFKPTTAKNKDEYFAMLPDERREILKTLDQIIRATAPGLNEFYAYNMPGYGAFDYTNYKKEQIKWPIISMASQKNYVSVYVCSVIDGQYIAEKYKDQLGKVSIGKSCIRLKKLDDLNIETFKKVIKEAAKNPGLVGANEHKKS
jgi:uncharacterized protein YdhG (YjbR/CyaY superfamily)